MVGMVDDAVTNISTGALINLVAAGAGTSTSAVQVNQYGSGLQLVINISAKSGTISLVVTVQGVDPVSGAVYTLLASSALTATGTTVLTVYPGVAVTANSSASTILPYNWQVSAVITGTTPSVTATIGASVIA